MAFVGTEISDVLLLERRTFEDERGTFAKVFDVAWFEDSHFKIVQVNVSHSLSKHTLRGMHFQIGNAVESKIVSCLTGRVFDVVVDLRRHSTTFLQWCGVELSEANRRSILIPRGCAHGFMTLEDDSRLVYLHDNLHDRNLERGIHHLDEDISISWPESPVVVSPRDLGLPRVRQYLEEFADEM